MGPCGSENITSKRHRVVTPLHGDSTLLRSLHLHHDFADSLVCKPLESVGDGLERNCVVDVRPYHTTGNLFHYVHQDMQVTTLLCRRQDPSLLKKESD